MLKSPRAVILTALPVECQAVREYLLHLHNKPHSEGSVYWVGTFHCESCEWIVMVAEIGQGNASAALETERAINFFKPDVALFVGVAGGLKDVHIGDVVAAEKVFCYESGKVSNNFLPRPKVWNSTHRMQHWARGCILFCVSGQPEKRMKRKMEGETHDHTPRIDRRTASGMRRPA